MLLRPLSCHDACLVGRPTNKNFLKLSQELKNPKYNEEPR